MSETIHCPGCQKPLRKNARFCGGCGFKLDPDAPRTSPGKRGVEGSRAASKKKAKRRSLSRSATQRTVLGIATCYVGVLALLLFFPWGSAESSEPAADLLLQGMLSCAMLLLGFLAAAVLGKGAVAESLTEPAEARFLGIGAAAGVAALAFNAALLTLLGAALGESQWHGFAVPDSWLLVLLGSAVLPAVAEEWLCRGVLWTGLKRITSERGTLILSSVLFAMLHGLGEARLLELPTRFLAGLVFGLLRSKSGSLQPGIVAHFANNSLACFLAH